MYRPSNRSSSRSSSRSPMSLPLETRKRKKISKNYKSTFCNVYSSSGFCPKGVRCNFFHNGEDDPIELRNQGYTVPPKAIYVSPTMAASVREDIPTPKEPKKTTLDPFAKVFVPATSFVMNPAANEFIPYVPSVSPSSDYIEKLQKEMVVLRAEHDKLKQKHNDMFPLPVISKFDPSIPEFIINTSVIVWKWNRCTQCASKSSMCDPVVFEQEDQKKMNAGWDIYTKNKSKNIMKYTLTGIDASYEINFKTMFQTNLETKTKRFVSREIKTTKTKNPKWTRGINEIHQMRTYKNQFEKSKTTILQPLKSTDQAYKIIEDEFLDATSGSNPIMRERFEIKNIVEVINPIAARLYELEKQRMNGTDEAMLFHGTRGVDVDTIIKSGGLDIRIGRNTSYFGQGIYTSASPNYSHESFGTFDQKSGCYVLMYVKVLLGKVKVYPDDGRDQLSKAPEGFDSVSSNVDGHSTTIFTVYNNSQVCVSYLIYYSSLKNNEDDD